MTYTTHKNVLKVIKNKPGKIKKFQKHNTPKKRSSGVTNKKCSLCLRVGGHVGQYGLSLCRQCFRDYSKKLGFKKYS